MAAVAQGRASGSRKSRQIDTNYGAPRAEYGAPSEEVLDLRGAESLPTYNEEPLPSYAEERLAAYNDLDSEASELDAKSEEASDPLAMLMKSVPGVPGEDYPIFSEAPETAFTCEGQVNGGNHFTS